MKLQDVGVAKGVEPKDVVHYSKCYRSALKECVMGLRKELESEYYKYHYIHACTILDNDNIQWSLALLMDTLYKGHNRKYTSL